MEKVAKKLEKEQKKKPLKNNATRKSLKKCSKKNPQTMQREEPCGKAQKSFKNTQKNSEPTDRKKAWRMSQKSHKFCLSFFFVCVKNGLRRSRPHYNFVLRSPSVLMRREDVTSPSFQSWDGKKLSSLQQSSACHFLLLLLLLLGG